MIKYSRQKRRYYI